MTEVEIKSIIEKRMGGTVTWLKVEEEGEVVANVHIEFTPQSDAEIHLPVNCRVININWVDRQLLCSTFIKHIEWWNKELKHIQKRR